MWLINIMGRPLQIADSGKPIHIMAESFPVFPAGNHSLVLAAIGLPLLTDSGNWHAATNSFEL
jgi:hypothetical protein